MQVLVHLVDNGIEALKDAEGDKVLTIRTRMEKTGATLEVIDSGIGFDAELKTQIFTQGFTTRAGHHGFGLHFCANAMAEMQGSIAAESEGKGRGARFVLKFPLSGNEMTRS